jgi:thiopurine S-methyltransferase
VGVELVEDAVRAFFAEHALVPTVTPRGAHVEYRAGAVTVFAGDFFATTRELLGPVDALYDRAALIALPAPMRERYARHLFSLLPPGAPGLVITLEYPQEKMAGPPFSVPEAKLRAHYAGRLVEHLDDVAEQSARAKEFGVSMTERAWAVRV